jgi:hypothetical protein
MLGRILFGIATVLLFLAAVGSHVIPNPTAWGFVTLALGFAVGGWTPWKRPA